MLSKVYYSHLKMIIVFVGAIREAGGAFGKKEKAIEDQYFRKQQAEQLKNLVDSHAKEIQHHKEAIKRHEEAMKVHEEALKHH